MVKPEADGIGGSKEEGVGTETDEGRVVEGPGIPQGNRKSMLGSKVSGMNAKLAVPLKGSISTLKGVDSKAIAAVRATAGGGGAENRVGGIKTIVKTR
jgi:hypothetical protein